jgi:hypothetical protein
MRPLVALVTLLFGFPPEIEISTTSLPPNAEIVDVVEDAIGYLNYKQG